MRGEGESGAIADQSAQCQSGGHRGVGPAGEGKRLSELETAVFCVDKITAPSRQALRRESITIKTSLSNGAAGGSPYSATSSKLASPGSKGLYGKNPVANTRMATGIRMLAASSSNTELRISSRLRRAAISTGMDRRKARRAAEERGKKLDLFNCGQRP
ncbi:uncharacterized protein P884DRAFT_12306 [Thermothelomyces heterothallicus CBS 202.75]|uniref:uncharacterized protein n=1 Tax=Thermothelomyces heterothallicus CBS 202.75 TaxID=1149848 RepID=UPI003742B64B